MMESRKSPTEIWARLASRTPRALGGIMAARVPHPMIGPRVIGYLYPFFSISGTSVCPSIAQPAMDEPDSVAKRTPPTTASKTQPSRYPSHPLLQGVHHVLSDPEEEHDLSHQEKERDRKQGKGGNRSGDAEHELRQPHFPSPEQIGEEHIHKEKAESDWDTEKEEEDQKREDQDKQQPPVHGITPVSAAFGLSKELPAKGEHIQWG